MSKSIKNVLCAVMAGVLSVVLLAVADACSRRIGDASEERALTEALQSVLPEGAPFEEIDVTGLGLPGSVTEVYTGQGGYVIRLMVNGYAPGMVILCGIGSDGAVVGAICEESRETLGKEKTYGERMTGVSAETVDSLTTVAGATKTTGGYNKAVRDALVAHGILTEGGDGDAGRT